MFKVESKIEIKASSEKVFLIYKDVDNWAEWDISLDFAKLEGKFESRAVGKLKPKKSPVVANIKFIEVIPNQFFQVHNVSILCIFDFYHKITEKENGIVEITHTIEISDRFKLLSPISSFFGKKIGEDMQKELPTVLENLKIMAETVCYP